MNIHSIRLKNIKSYGEGSDGNGVIVSFESGVNRIAGKNGHGKTTLIESLGYALFLTQPQHEENFRLDKSFLRHGCKAGEIDVTFGYQGATYRIERGLGSQNKRRSKVIDTSDGSTCAENDAEVSQFLCELFGFPDGARFSELFAKLIGVRQGWLTRPFDSKPGASKRFFEPLLEVEIFRRCFDELKPALDQIAVLRQEQEVKLAGIEAKIQDRADSPEKLKQCQEEKTRLGGLLKKAEKEQGESCKTKEALEQKEKAIQQAEKARDQAKNTAEKATEQRKLADGQVEESKKAAAKIKSTSAAHEAFLAAEKALKQLREREKAQGQLEKQKAETDKRRIEREGKAKAAADQADTFAKQKEAKEKELGTVRGKLKPLKEALTQSEKSYQDGQVVAEQLDNDQDELRAFARRLPDFRAERDEELKKVEKLAGELGAWDPKKLADAKDRETKAAESRQSLRDKLAETRERKASLAKQLEQIGGGVCPFLKEQCRQFDPAKVQGDVETIEKAIGELVGKLTAAEKEHNAARTDREALSGQENQLSAKRNQLDDEIGSYLRAVRGMIPTAATEAATRVPKHIEGDQQSFPSAPNVPGKVEDALGVRKLHDELVRFCDDVESWWNTLNPRIDTKLAALERAKIKRLKDEHTLEGFQKQIADLQKEIEERIRDEKGKREESTDAGEGAKKAACEIATLEEQLKQYADVAEGITKQGALLDLHRDSHEAFIAAKPTADLLKDREVDLGAKKKAEGERAKELKDREKALEETQKGFDPEQLTAARKDYEDKSEAATTCRNNLKHAEKALEQEEKRFGEWEKAKKAREAVDTELNKLASAADLGQLGRSVLQKSAPAVAQHLCTRIAGRAQRIFNQINHYPIELTWEANNYSLRIAPGDRRFAMLSGGEQTKLALAMTLAMAQEFSDLRFCIFDEPTYGVDADSRSLLADAILEAQDAAGLEQLLLVSHDDAFEGKIEHAILLSKSAQSGSEVLSME